MAKAKKLNGAAAWIMVVFAFVTLMVGGTMAYATNRANIMLNTASIDQLVKMQQQVARTERLVMELAIRADIPLE